MPDSDTELTRGLPGSVSRRKFLGIAGSSAIAGFAGCSEGEHTVEVVNQEGKDIISDVTSEWTTVTHSDHSHTRLGVKITMTASASEVGVSNAFLYHDGEVVSREEMTPTQTEVPLALLATESDGADSKVPDSYTYPLKFVNASNGIVSKAILETSTEK